MVGAVFTVNTVAEVIPVIKVLAAIAPVPETNVTKLPSAKPEVLVTVILVVALETPVRVLVAVEMAVPLTVKLPKAKRPEAVTLAEILKPLTMVPLPFKVAEPLPKVTVWPVPKSAFTPLLYSNALLVVAEAPSICGFMILRFPAVRYNNCDWNEHNAVPEATFCVAETVAAAKAVVGAAEATNVVAFVILETVVPGAKTPVPAETVTTSPTLRPTVLATVIVVPELEAVAEE